MPRPSASTPSSGAAAGLAFVTLLPLLVWPGLDQPFSLPKIVALTAAAPLLLVATSPARATPIRARLFWIAAAWIASFALAALAADVPSFPVTLLGIAAPVFAIALLRTGAASTQVALAQTCGATVAAGIALLQWTGLDPFGLAGWHAPIQAASVRMRVFSTLGNPNFVGTLLAMCLPLAVAGATVARTWRPRLAWASAIGLQVLAVVATGSRGAVLGVAASAIAACVLGRLPRRSLIVAATLGFAILASATSPARRLDTTFEGRLYLWRILGQAAASEPFTGHGPGSGALHFRDWQRDADARGETDPRFRGATDHIHNDYLEALVERGLPGLLTLLLALFSSCRLARPGQASGLAPAFNPALAGVASVVAGAACALVDFPLARPADLVWWWLAVASVHQEASARIPAV